MTKIRLPYVVSDKDRHGNRRYYFRRRFAGSSKAVKIRLPGFPGSKEFMEAYQGALSSAGGLSSSLERTPKGSFGYVCKSYYASPQFKALSKSTQLWRRRVLDDICRKHGGDPIERMRPIHVRKLRDEKADMPGASLTRLKALKALFRWAVEEELVTHDPTQDVKRIPYSTKGHHSWTLEEVETFERIHEVGSKARLALALMLYTACRRSDVVKLGPQHIHEGRLGFRQSKNANRDPVDIDIPVHKDLADIIGKTPSGHMNFLTTEYGRPFSIAGFGNRFREWCNRAGLSHCSAHGLRKAAAARLAEAGATPYEIMAVTGHKSLEEVERYTRAARKKGLADSAIAKIKG
jgi:integrase/recombinase XerD